MIDIALALVVLCYLLTKASQVGRRRPGLPPGPPTLPVLGNLHLLSPTYTHLRDFSYQILGSVTLADFAHRFTEWARKYGDIFSLTLGPGVMVVLSSAHAVREILERQSAVTSSRPPSHFDDILHEGKYLAICQASNNWRLLRKAANSLLTPQSAVKHIPLQRAESLQLMYDVMKAPERTWWHLRRAATSAVFSVLWGKRAPKIDSQDVAMVFEIAEAETQVYTPGKHAPVDLLPILKYVPERWAPWKGICRDLRELQMSFYTRLTNECKERMYSSQQVDTLCFMDAVVKRQQELELTDDMAALLGAVLLEGGSDTTATFMQSFLLMVTAHPEVQRKLHEEMDRVVGDGRTPNMDDFHNLPYLQATLKETHRIRPVFPIGIPHATLDDIMYEDYIIPKDSTVAINLWGIYHDHDVFDDPETFNPDRYMTSEFGVRPGVDCAAFKHSLPFGVGRRICPGRHVAEQAMRIQATDLIWGFKFTSKEPIDIDAYLPGLVLASKPFTVSVEPRSVRHEEMIRKEFLDAIPAFAPYEERLSVEEKEWLAKNRLGGA